MTEKNTFQAIKNPYYAGNPAKPEIFFGREESFKWIEEWISHGGLHVTLLIGERRSGKTSLLKQIEYGRLQQAGEAVFCNFHAMAARIEQDDDFPREIGEAILSNERFAKFSSGFEQEEGLSWTARLERLFKQALEETPTHRLIMLCDEFEAIEELFKQEKLGEEATKWIATVLEQQVYFVITSSHGFESELINKILNRVSRQLKVHELEEKDALALIQEPVKNLLNYDTDSLRLIYRLSGGHPFYTQLICQNLVSYLNAEAHTHQVSKAEIEPVVKFLVENPAGHLQDTWADPAQRQVAESERPKFITEIRHVLGALAHSLENAEDYADTQRILATAAQKRFTQVSDETQLFRVLGWLWKNTRLVERNKEECYRFRHELFRQWLVHEIQLGSDIEAETLGESSDAPEEHWPEESEARPFAEKLKFLLQDGAILLAEREELDEIAATCGLSLSQTERHEQRLRRQWHTQSWGWAEEYRESCRALQAIHGRQIPKTEMARLRACYVERNRITPATAREVEQYLGLSGGHSWLWLSAASLVVAVAGVAWWQWPEDGPMPTLNQVPVAGEDRLETAYNTPLKISISQLLSNDSDADGQPLRIIQVMEGQSGKASLSGEEISFIPVEGFSGEAGFSYLLSDGYGGETQGQVVVTVAESRLPKVPSPSATDTPAQVDAEEQRRLNKLQQAFEPTVEPSVPEAETPAQVDAEEQRRLNKLRQAFEPTVEPSVPEAETPAQVDAEEQRRLNKLRQAFEPAEADPEPVTPETGAQPPSMTEAQRRSDKLKSAFEEKSQ